ncbi:MAG: electron transport complex subunit RsxE [Proteobacteria bacterium]|nr:electron transport complex subunit RsxE [Pseudomonadota bacterium]
MTSAVFPIATAAALQQNVVTVRLLALCPMLAVSVSVSAALTLGVLTTLVMMSTGTVVALLRHQVPDAVRLPVLLLLTASAVVLLDLAMAAEAANMHRQLGIFLPLIITNCAVLARLELFARKQQPLAAAIDGAASGIGMTAVLVLLAFLREFFATGAVATFQLFPASSGFVAAGLPAGGFILFGLLLAVINKLKKRTDLLKGCV